MEVDLGGLEVRVTEPERDARGVDPGVQKRHRAGVPQGVRSDVLPGQARAVLGCGAGVSGDELAGGGSRELLSGAGREQRGSRDGRELSDPCGQERDGVLLQRDDALLASFAEAFELAVRADLDAVDAQADQFTDPEPGLDAQVQQQPVTSADPGAGVRGRDERFGFGAGQERDECCFRAFRGDREDLTDRVDRVGGAVAGVGEERP